MRSWKRGKGDISLRDVRKTTFGTASGAAPPEGWLLSGDVIVISNQSKKSFISADNADDDDIDYTLMTLGNAKC